MLNQNSEYDKIQDEQIKQKPMWGCLILLFWSVYLWFIIFLESL